MAKKVTIEGSDKLQSLSDAWGGQAGNEAETHYGTNVPAGAEWGMNRGEVERFIKKQFGNKVGYFFRTDENLLLGFATEDDYLAWVSDPENNPPVASSSLPSLVNEDVYQVRAYLEAVPNEIQRSRDISINVRGTSIVQFATGGTEELQESLNVIIETSPTGNAGSWTSRIVGTVSANAQTYKTFSLESYLSLGTNYVRVRVSSDQATSIPISFTLNVVNLYLTPATDFSVIPTDAVSLSYLIGGSINKTIQFEFGTGRGNNFVSSYTTAVSLGEQTWAQTARTFQFTEAALLTAGRHTVRARLWVDSSVYTDWVESEYMVAGSSAMVVVNDIQTGLSNWTAVKFFDWALFTPDGEPLAVVFKLYDENDESVYGTWNFTAENGETYSFTTQLALSISENISIFAGNMHIEDAEGNELAPSVQFTFANSAEFSPVSGADFVMLPSNRNNSEVNKATIINEAGSTPVTVGSNFVGFGWLNDGWVDVPKDLNNEEAGTLRALHIPAGHKVEIEYNPFSDFTAGANANATFELDFRTSNILDSDEAIVRIGTLVNDKIWGFEMLPTKAYMMTEENRTVEDQDADWAEDERTHLAVNIVSVIYNPTKTLHYVRIFINGIIEREFLFNTTDKFTAASGVKIELGNSSSDLDVFSIRNYKTALTTADVMRNYRASMDTVAEKQAFKEKNDITLNEKISFARCVALGLNVIGHTGELPKYGKATGNPTYRGVTLQIHINGDEEHSGILTNLEAKGQGTTAMGYYDWNQSYKITGSTKHLTEAGAQKAVDDGTGYSIGEDEYAAKKLVGKINFASSMQSHKLGLTWIFTEVFKELVSANKMSKPSQFTPYPNARIAVFEKPFLFFHRQTENDEWEYKYLMTFGAGKGDKPTFGFKVSDNPAKDTSNMLMVEGADNDPALCNFARPWDDSITYNPSSEAWFDGSVKCINFGFGATTEVDGFEYPSSTDAINAIKAFWNFVYEHHTGITYYTGTLENLQAGVAYVEGNKAVETKRLYWIANDTSANASRYDLFRYNGTTWVPAGANQSTFNVQEHYTLLNNNTAPSWNGKTNKQINDEIIALRRAHFKANAETYFHVDDALYHSCFIKLFAGTDNRAKNTYYYTDPTTFKIRWMQDDLDTVIKTNNLGQNRKPYYVEEHDTDATGAYYWQGEHNAFYNLLEEVYCDVSNDSNDRMPAMMREMLSVMAAKGGTVMGYLEQRLIFVQDYFPAIAYNEQARLVYEAAQAAQTGSNPEYGNAIQAITQSCGSQRWSEYQWLKDRVMYISSWCEFGEFASGTTAAGALNFRSAAGNFNFRLTPAKWMYPRIGKGTSRIPAKSENSVQISRVRVEPKTAFNYLEFISEGDTDVYIRGIDYLLDIGNMNVYLQPSPFGFRGRRLQQINVNPNGTDTNHFAASSISNTATNIKAFVLRNVTTVSGTLDLSDCYRLEKIDISGSTFTGISLPKTERLTALVLPATLTSLTIDGQPNIGDTTLDANACFTLAGVSSLTSLKVVGNTNITTDSTFRDTLISAINREGLTSLTLDGLNLTMSSTIFDKMLNIDNLSLKGVITVTGTFNFALKMKMLAKLTNIGVDLQVNISNQVALQSVAIGGERYISETGQYQYEIIPSPANANAFTSVEFSVADAGNKATIDPNTGLLTVNALNEEGDDSKISISVSVKRSGLSDVDSVPYEVGLWEHECALGDFVYTDGTFEDVINPLKTIVGICYHIGADYTETINGETITRKDRRMVGLDRLYLPITLGSTTTNVSSISPYNNSSYGWAGLVTTDTPVFNKIYNPPVDEYTNSTYMNGIDVKEFGISQIRAVFSNANDAADNVLEYGDFREYLGRKMPSGMWNTIMRIMSRNRIILDGNFQFEAPVSTPNETEMEALKRCITDAVVLKNEMRYNVLFYPAPSMCYAYAPCERFGEHKWYLPTGGELLEIYNNAKASATAIAKSYSGTSWCSDKYSISGCAYFNMSNGTPSYSNGTNGMQHYYVWPCCQF